MPRRIQFVKLKECLNLPASQRIKILSQNSPTEMLPCHLFQSQNPTPHISTALFLSLNHFQDNNIKHHNKSYNNSLKRSYSAENCLSNNNWGLESRSNKLFRSLCMSAGRGSLELLQRLESRLRWWRWRCWLRRQGEEGLER